MFLGKNTSLHSPLNHLLILHSKTLHTDIFQQDVSLWSTYTLTKKYKLQLVQILGIAIVF